MIDEENLQRNALEVGTYLLKGFETLRDKYGDIIGDVRGKVRRRIIRRRFNYISILMPLRNQTFASLIPPSPTIVVDIDDAAAVCIILASNMGLLKARLTSSIL